MQEQSQVERQKMLAELELADKDRLYMRTFIDERLMKLEKNLEENTKKKANFEPKDSERQVRTKRAETSLNQRSD